MRQSVRIATLVIFSNILGIASSFAGSWWFSVGVNHRSMDIGVSGSTYSQDQQVSGAQPGTRFGAAQVSESETSRRTTSRDIPGRSISRLPDIGSTTGFSNRTYDNGNVRLDPGTTDPSALEPGLTWNWGYDDGTQYSATAGTLTFTATGIDESSFSRSTRTTVNGQRVAVSRGERIGVKTVEDRPVRLNDQISGLGLSAEVGYVAHETPKSEAGVVLALNAAWGANTHLQDTPYRQEIIRQQIERTERSATSYEITRSDAIRVNGSKVYSDTYALQGVTPPPAPYQGSYDGPGPVIPNRPTSRTSRPLGGDGSEQVISSRTSTSTPLRSSPKISERVVSSETYDAYTVVDFDLDADLYELLFGPRINFLLHRGIRMYASPYISLNVIDYSVSRNEEFIVNRGGNPQVAEAWRDTASDTRAVFGYGAQLGIQAELKNNWFVAADAAYTHVPDDVSFRVGPNDIHIDPSSYSARVMVGRRFGAPEPQKNASQEKL